MKTKILPLLLVVSGIVIGFVLAKLISSEKDTSDIEKKPLYWVAPMDPNYRRDQPGKSPMGMDLIPVYEDESNSESTGSIFISPNVVNNLGVRTGLVEKGSLHSTIKTVGFVTYNENKLVHIHPRVSGWIETLNIKAEGDPVEKGQPIYQIYSPELVNAQEELLLALKRNNNELMVAAEARLKALHISESLIQKIKTKRQVSQKITFYSPISGVVDNLNIREGFYVKPGTTLMSIGDLSSVWVEAELFERQAGYVNLGDSVSMTLGYLPGREWQGRVDYIYPTLNEKNRTIRLRSIFDNEKRALKPNMFTEVTIDSSISDNLVLVPREAVIRTGNQDRVVLALGDGKFKSIQVVLGRHDNTKYEILSGLKVGEKVVTSAQFLIDSESSKTSDFNRIDFHDGTVQQARVDGVVNTINRVTRVANISRGAIEKWGRPPATMDYGVSNMVDFDQMMEGQSIDFTFEIRGDQFVIIDIHSSNIDE